MSFWIGETVVTETEFSGARRDNKDLADGIQNDGAY